MFSFHRLAKIAYVLVLGTAVILLSRPAPVQAQRTIAYAFIPGQISFILGRGILAGFSSPLNSYVAASAMLTQAGIPSGMGIFGANGMNGGMGIAGGGNAGGLGGGNMMGGGMMGMGGGMLGMGGMGGGGGMMMGMGGMRGGMGGMGGFAGKGFGGFNGKKPI